jgi:CHAT domain-containing protein/tetratricopeptide (TPR) repeat protein
MTCVSHNECGNFTVPNIALFARCAAARIPMIVLSMVLLTTAGFAQNQSQANSSLVQPLVPILVPGKSVERTLSPHESVTFALPVHAGLYSEVHVRQIQGMTQSFLIGLDGHDSLPHFNDGGIGSVERIPLIAAQSGTVHLRIESRERHVLVIFQVTRSLERVQLPRDQEIVQAESALTEAEYVRHRTGFHSTPKVQNSAYILALYDRAHRLAVEAGDDTLVRQSLIGKARYQIFNSAEYQQGVQTATQATQLSPAIGDIDQQALAWKTLASALAFVDHYDESITASEHAIALYRETGDRYWQGIVLGNLADTYREIGDSGKAIEAAKEALHFAQQLSDDYGVAYTQATIGEIYQGRGQYQQAIDAYDAALSTANIVNYPQVEGEVWSDLGQLYAKLGDWQRAKNAYVQALPILQKDGDDINKIEVLGHLGELTLHAKNPRQAQQYFRQGLMRAREQRLIREEAFLNAGLARTCLEIHCAEDPLLTLLQAQHEAEQIHQVDGEAAIDAAIGDVLARRHDDSGAMHAYAQSATLWQQIPNSSELAAVAADMARLDVRRGQLQSARLQIYKALDAIEASRARIDSDALRTSYFTSKHSYYDAAVDVLMRLDKVWPHHGYGEQAWTVAERDRARTLLDELQEGGDMDASTSTQQLKQKSAALELKLRDAEGKLSRLGSTSADIVQAQQLQRNIHDMLLQADQLEARHRASNPAYHALLEESQVSPVVFGPNVLTDGTALVEYWLGSVHSYLWIVTAAGVRSFRLPDRKSLDGLVHSYQQSMLARDKFMAGEDMQARMLRIQKSDAHLSAQSRRLAAILLPEQFSPSVHRLLIVADGSLLSMPFAALELPRLHAGPFRYLIEKYDLVYEPSASTAVAFLAKRTQYSDRSRIAIFADPVYSHADARVKTPDERPAVQVSQAPVLRQASIAGLSELPRLPGSRKEATAIAQIAGASSTSLFLGFDASPQKVEEIDWKSYAAAHFAAHAIVDTEHPEFSGIVLSMFHRNGSPADGVLWLHDIYRLHMPVSLVALSGCETADGKSIPGEGINGLSRAFLYAGAHSVIGTLWDAEDSSSSELMQSFYKKFLRQHLAAAASLRAAQQRVLSDASHRAPYYWAGFVLEGDWRGR